MTSDQVLSDLAEYARTTNSELPLEEQVRRAERLERLLEEPVVGDILSTIKGTLISRWAGSHDLVEREQCWTGMQVLLLATQIANGIIQDGEVARERLRDRV